MGGLGAWISNEVGLGILRNILMAAGASLVTDGLLTQGQLTSVVGGLAVIIGVVVSAIANKNKAEANAVVTAVKANPAVTLVPANTFAGPKPLVVVKPISNPFSDLPPPSLSSTGH